MTRIVDVKLESGEPLLVEIDDLASGSNRNGPVTRSWRAGEDIVPTSETLDSALARITPASRAIIAGLRDTADPPSEILVEFGIKLNAEASVIVARTSGEANFKVALKWTRPRSGEERS